MRWKRTELAYLACIQPLRVGPRFAALQIGKVAGLLACLWCICRWSALRRSAQRHELGLEANRASGLVPGSGECCLG